ncbi:PGR5-like protein 1A, chloroplastic [Cinnamomum micranthum f. kanehirae]|uniref:PGR5-like protein 1A, chloroplastic n=1 Tax=Cinnamomum micranthum f. kanehirae TaxID=337451 RepID=A0A3S3M431_9MAGN|nr:PGR5-like protein 1A, chloroplastic [Cinnamomum micranthum f. kanehirae]
MACTCPFPPHVTVSKLGRTQLVVPSSFFSICRRLWKIPRITISISSSSSSGGVVFPCRVRSSHSSELAFSQGPSCIFVGPLETASKELLEALYRQARDAYYSGEPLIVDDMFDKVELKLRLYGSKSVVKYPRCSLRRQSTYADAEEDPSLVLALASVWSFLLTFSSLALLVPTIYTISLAYQDAVNSRLSPSSTTSALEFLTTLNGILFMGLGSLIGYPIALASVRALQGLWRNDLVALKGSCPNCGEEAEQSNQSPHRADCHVCQCALEFRTKVEQFISRPGRRWAYGRIYLVPGTGAKRRRLK